MNDHNNDPTDLILEVSERRRPCIIDDREGVYWIERRDDGGIDMVVEFADGTGLRYENLVPNSYEIASPDPEVMTVEKIDIQADNYEVLRDTALEEWRRLLSIHPRRRN